MYSEHIGKALRNEVKRHKGKAKSSRCKLITKLARYRLFAVTGKWFDKPAMDNRFKEEE